MLDLKKVETKNLKEGFVVAKQVITDNTILLEKGNLITLDHIKLLKNWKIPHIFIIDKIVVPTVDKKKRQVLNITVKKTSKIFSSPAENYIPINDKKSLQNYQLDLSQDPSDLRAQQVKHPPLYKPDRSQTNREWATQMYKSEIAKTEEIIELARKSKIQDNAIIKLVQKILDGIKTCPEEKLMLTTVETPENYLVAHSVNTCILSLATGLAMKLRHEQLVTLGIAGIVHDLGMAQVDSSIWQSSKILDDDEFFEITKHTVWGADMLCKTNLLCGLPANVAYQHHERCDGQGYPKGKKGRQINLMSSIVACADVFAALISNRPYRQAFSDHEALLLMDQMAGTILQEKPLYHLLAQAEMYDLIEKRPAKNILLIDNDSKILKLARNIIKHPRVVIFSSENAQLAMAFLQDMIPDVIIVDFKGLDMSQKAFLDEFYSYEGSENCSIIVASNRISKQDVANRFSVGIDDYILKPFNPFYFKQKMLSFIGIGGVQALKPKIITQENKANDRIH